MKMLYIARDRRALAKTEAALHTIAQNVTIEYVTDLPAARRWLDTHTDLAMLVVEVASDDPVCASFIRHLRRSGMMAPAIVVSVAAPVTEIVRLGAEADAVIAKTDTFAADLAAVLERIPGSLAAPSRPVEGIQADLPPGLTFDRAPVQSILDDRAAAERRAVEAQVARAAAERQAAEARSAAAASASQLVRREAELQAELSLVTAAQDQLRHQLLEAEAAMRRLEEATDQQLNVASKASKASNAKEDALEASLAEQTAERERLERQLAELLAAHETLKRRRAADEKAMATRLAAYEQQKDSRLTQIASAEAELRAALDARDAEVRAATTRESELRAELARVTDVQDQLQVQLVDARDTMRRLESIAREREVTTQAAAARQTTLEAALAEETSTRSALDQQLSELRRAYDTLREQQAAASQTLASRFAAYREQVETRLAHSAAEAAALRSAVTEREDDARAVSARESSLQAELDKQADALRASSEAHEAAAQASAERQAALERQLTELAGARAELERETTTLRATYDALVRTAVERETALVNREAERQALEVQLAEVRAANDALRERQTADELALRAEFDAYRRQAEERIAHAAAEEAALVSVVRTRESELEAAAAREADLRSALANRDSDLASRDAELANRDSVVASSVQLAAARQAQLESAQAEQEAVRTALESELSALREAHEALRVQRTADEQVLAAEFAAYRQQAEAQLARAADGEASLLAAVSARESEVQAAATREAMLQSALLSRDTALRTTTDELRSSMEAAAARQAELETALREQTASRQALEKELDDVRTALVALRERLSSEQQAAAARLGQAAAEEALLRAALSEREGEVRASAERQASLERQLADRNAAHQALEERLVALRLAQQDALESAQAQAAADRQKFERNAADARSPLEQLQQVVERQTRELESTATQHAEFREQADARLRQASEQAEALRATAERAERDRQTAVREAASRLTALESELATQAAERQALERRLLDARTAHDQLVERHTAETAAALARLNDVQATADARLREAEANAATAFRNAEETVEAERRALREGAAREEALQAELERRTIARVAMEKQLAGALAARQEYEQHAVQRERQLDSELRSEMTRRQSAEQELEVVRQAAEQARVCLIDELTTLRESSRTRERQLEEDIARALAQWERERADADSKARELESDAGGLRTYLATTQEQVARLEAEREKARESFEYAQRTFASDLARQRDEMEMLRRTLDNTRATAAATLERVSLERATERANLEELLASRTAQLEDQTARRLAADEASAKVRADLEQRLGTALQDAERERTVVAQQRDRLTKLDQDLSVTSKQRDTLRVEADRVPQMQAQIDDLRKEHHRRFASLPASLCRCRPDGGMTEVSKSLATLLGYETPEDLQKVDLATAVFSSADELRWLIDRCQKSRGAESIETTWRRRDGGHVVVRVLAVAATPDAIDLVVQDITTVRKLEEKLRHAQRMEAVARYASEVSVTCDNLFKYVTQEGQRWLASVDSEAARYQGELLLDEVARASAFLRQLAVYGDQEKNAPEHVDVNKVLREMEPVLRRVAGSQIDVVLPKATAPINVDVEVERVERVLVNVAAYGRSRMRKGGRLMFDVAPVVLDRAFVTKYPNVRPGAHVLLTVNEARVSDAGPAIQALSESDATEPTADDPGVDIGALQTLVSDCGGHLWLTAEPPGDMTLKIHLPRRVLDEAEVEAVPVQKTGGRPRWFSRLAGSRH